MHEAESQLAPYWEKTKDIVLRPGTLGGLMGIGELSTVQTANLVQRTVLTKTANVGLLSTIGYFAYTRKDQPWDRRIVGATVAGTLALFGAEG